MLLDQDGRKNEGLKEGRDEEGSSRKEGRSVYAADELQKERDGEREIWVSCCKVSVSLNVIIIALYLWNCTVSGQGHVPFTLS